MQVIQIIVNVPDDFDAAEDVWEIQQFINETWTVTVHCHDCGEEHEPGDHDYCSECSMYHPSGYVCEENSK